MAAAKAAPLLRLDAFEKLAVFVEMRCLNEAGIFRIPGDNLEIEEIVKSLYKDVSEIDLSKCDPNSVAGALKLYIRNQSHPLLPASIFSPFTMNMPKNMDPTQERAQVKQLIRLFAHLPPENKPILRRLLRLLGTVAERADVTKMPSSNLGVVFGPTLMRAETTMSMEEDFKMSSLSAKLCSFMIKHYISITNALPEGCEGYKIFGQPPAMTQRELDVLSTNADIRTYNEKEHILTEGEENDFLFLILEGTVSIEIKSESLGLMQKGSFIGEMSFLGAEVVSASVVAMERSQLLAINSAFLNSIFAVEHELFMKFYWRMADTLAQRLMTVPQRSMSQPSGGRGSYTMYSVVMHTRQVVVRVFINSEVPSYKTMLCDASEKILTVLTRALHLFNISANPTSYCLYSISYDTCSCGTAPLASDSEVGSVTHAFSAFPTLLCLSQAGSTPSTSKVRLLIDQGAVVKEYTCKLSGTNGKLYISKTYIAHFSKVLGRERRKLFNYDQVSLHPREGKKIKLSSKGKSKTHTLHFRTEVQAEEAVNLMHVIQEKAESSDQKIEMSKCATNVARAVVVEPFNATNWTELSLPLDAVVLVLIQDEGKSLFSKPGWWCGERAGCSGWFPKGCVRLLVEPPSNKELTENGYKPTALTGLPTKEDWKSILRGGKTVSYKAGDTILKQGDQLQRLYQIISGSCVATQVIHDPAQDSRRVLSLGVLRTESTFGEVSFLLGGGATASVVAKEATEVYVIEAEYLKRLFNDAPLIGGRFFKYLASVIALRCSQAEELASQPQPLQVEVRASNARTPGSRRRQGMKALDKAALLQLQEQQASLPPMSPPVAARVPPQRGSPLGTSRVTPVMSPSSPLTQGTPPVQARKPSPVAKEIAPIVARGPSPAPPPRTGAVRPPRVPPVKDEDSGRVGGVGGLGHGRGIVGLSPNPMRREYSPPQTTSASLSLATPTPVQSGSGATRGRGVSPARASPPRGGVGRAAPPVRGGNVRGVPRGMPRGRARGAPSPRGRAAGAGAGAGAGFARTNVPRGLAARPPGS